MANRSDDIIKEMKVFMNFRGNCNYWDPDSDNTVYVKKCLVTGGGHFYIYRLPDAPFCDTGYCTEEDLSTTTTMTTTKSTTTTPTTTMPTTTTPTTTTTCAGIQDPNRDGACLCKSVYNITPAIIDCGYFHKVVGNVLQYEVLICWNESQLSF